MGLGELFSAGGSAAGGARGTGQVRQHRGKRAGRARLCPEGLPRPLALPRQLPALRGRGDTRPGSAPAPAQPLVRATPLLRGSRPGLARAGPGPCGIQGHCSAPPGSAVCGVRAVQPEPPRSCGPCRVGSRGRAARLARAVPQFPREQWSPQKASPLLLCNCPGPHLLA